MLENMLAELKLPKKIMYDVGAWKNHIVARAQCPVTDKMVYFKITECDTLGDRNSRSSILHGDMLAALEELGYYPAGEENTLFLGEDK